MAPSKTFTTALVVAALASQAAAHPEFRARIPNAMNVKGVDAIGHVDTAGGGPRNDFGKAFAAAGLAWTKELCQADSDGDGQTNGQELGDPCCEWVEKTNEKTQWTTGVSSPGDPKSKSDPTLWANVKCAGASNSTSSSNSTTPSATTATPSITTAAPSSTTKAPTATTAAPKSSASLATLTVAASAVATAAAFLL